MGATALANRKMYENPKTKIFGVKFAHRLYEPVPREAGFKDQGVNDIVLSVESDEDKDIIFQFKLAKGAKEMIIRAYDPNIRDKATTEVDVKTPDLTKVESDPNATSSEKHDAQKILAMMNRSKSGIKNSSLTRIANQLLKEKKDDKRRT